MTSLADETETLRLIVLYDEEGSGPFSEESFADSPRMSACGTIESNCTSSRARYEIRAEPERYQSIQLRQLNGEGNPILGGLRWKGPSYPDRVEMTCGFKGAKVEEACKLTKLHYTPNPDTSGEHNRRPVGTGRHDQCSPWS